jgi:hypothetical protein
MLGSPKGLSEEKAARMMVALREGQRPAAPRSRLPARTMRPLGKGKEPEAPSLQPCRGSVLSALSFQNANARRRTRAESAPEGKRNGNFRHGGRTKEAVAISRYINELARLVRGLVKAYAKLGQTKLCAKINAGDIIAYKHDRKTPSQAVYQSLSSPSILRLTKTLRDNGWR